MSSGPTCRAKSASPSGDAANTARASDSTKRRRSGLSMPDTRISAADSSVAARALDAGAEATILARRSPTGKRVMMMVTNLSTRLSAGIARVSRIIGLGLTVVAMLGTTTVSAQVSESTEDWPAWQKVAVGSLGATSLMSTIALIGAAADDDPDDDGPVTNSGNTVSDSGGGSDSGDSNSGDSNSGDSNSGDSNSDSNGNARKGQGYVEELKDELLMLVNVGDFGGGSGDSVDSLAVEYPVLASYYRELIAEHPEVIDATNENVQGATLVERLNRVMVAHLFGSGGR